MRGRTEAGTGQYEQNQEQEKKNRTIINPRLEKRLPNLVTSHPYIIAKFVTKHTILQKQQTKAQ